MPTPNLVAEMATAHRRTLSRLRHADPNTAKLDEAVKIADALLRKLSEVDQDRRLTPTGKAEAREKAAGDAMAAGEKWFAPIRDGLNGNERAARAELLETVSAPRSSDVASRFEQALLRAEIRRATAGLDTLAVETLYRTGGAMVRAALDELPRIENREGVVSVRPFVSAETRDAVLLEAASKLRPDLADRLHDVALVRGVAEVVMSALTAMVKQELPDYEPAGSAA